MSKKLYNRSIHGTQMQEITMREVLGGLEEVAVMLSYNPWPGDFEIIAIYPAEQESEACQEKIVINATSEGRPKAEIISYQERKNILLKKYA